MNWERICNLAEGAMLNADAASALVTIAQAYERAAFTVHTRCPQCQGRRWMDEGSWRYHHEPECPFAVLEAISTKWEALQ